MVATLRATDGPSDGQLLFNTHSSQAVTSPDEDWVDYYYSWGTSVATDSPGMSKMLLETVNAAFVEDKVVLEAQWRNVKERPHAKHVGLLLDAGPEKMLLLLDKFLATVFTILTGMSYIQAIGKPRERG